RGRREGLARPDPPEPTTAVLDCMGPSVGMGGDRYQCLTTVLSAPTGSGSASPRSLAPRPRSLDSRFRGRGCTPWPRGYSSGREAQTMRVPRRRGGCSLSSITESVDVQVPVSTAYNQWTQFETVPQLMEGVGEIRQIDDTHMHWVTKVGGVKREFDATVTEQHPDERVAWKSDSGPTHAGVITFHRLDED